VIESTACCCSRDVRSARGAGTTSAARPVWSCAVPIACCTTAEAKPERKARLARAAGAGAATMLSIEALAAALRQAAESDVRYPVYLQVAEECLYTSRLTGGLVLARHYILKDYQGRDMPGGVVLEHNAVVAGQATSRNAPFAGNDWDYISAGHQAQYNFYQTFMAANPEVPMLPVAVFVRETNGVDYGVLAVEATPGRIIINGVDKSSLPECGPNVPRLF
jgi:hypothetical protein